MKINMSHGSGGRETAWLIETIFMKHFRGDHNRAMEDAALLPAGERIAFTTDSFVVKPLFFRGGDIGRLAVCGTVNDLLTSGAVPSYMSAAFIIEEGMATDDLERIAQSMRDTANEAGVQIVTGDTKVIEGEGGLYLNTAGVGVLRDEEIHLCDAGEGDALLVSGTLGDHHACILSHRMGVENDIQSDVAPLNKIIEALRGKVTLHGLRDITRGGLATVLCELAAATGLRAALFEKDLPVSDAVRGLTKLLGLDPLYMGNEGNMLVVVPGADAEKALHLLRQTEQGRNASIVGQLTAGSGCVLHTVLGGRRVLLPLAGEGLPRIC